MSKLTSVAVAVPLEPRSVPTEALEALEQAHKRDMVAMEARCIALERQLRDNGIEPAVGTESELYEMCCRMMYALRMVQVALSDMGPSKEMLGHWR